jgi:hypothetical protein
MFHLNGLKYCKRASRCVAILIAATVLVGSAQIPSASAEAMWHVEVTDGVTYERCTSRVKSLASLLEKKFDASAATGSYSFSLFDILKSESVDAAFRCHGNALLIVVHAEDGVTAKKVALSLRDEIQRNF